MVPVTLAQKKILPRHILTLLCIILTLVAGVLLPSLQNNHNIAWVIGCFFGIAESIIVVFPLMKIRHFFTEFEKKICSSGAFLAIHLASKWALNYFAHNHVVTKISGTHEETPKTLWFKTPNILEFFKVYSYLGCGMALVAWGLICWSERDNRFDGIEDEEGVVFIANNFNDEYEVDAESKFECYMLII